MRRRVALVPVFLAAIGLVATVFAVPATAQDTSGAPAPVSLASVMSGEGGGVSATATSSFDMERATVMLRVNNTTAASVLLEVPYGAMFGPEDDAQQTVVTAGLEGAEAASLARTGATPTIEAPPGESAHALIGFCGEKLDASPAYAVPVAYRSVAKDPLPKVLRNIAAQEPDATVAQDAVWWVTDKPTVPVEDPGVAALLEGVDTAAFAAAPSKVVPSESYKPEWDGGKRPAMIAPIGLGRGGPSPVLQLSILLLAMLAGIGVVLFVVKRKPAMATVGGRAGASPTPAAKPAGWYGDPWSPGQRYWDGQRWTDARRSR